ncbi:hypothetical protein K439DRAFT_1639541, partial [Ramaria rubella]
MLPDIRIDANVVVSQPSKSVARSCLDDSTSNLVSHKERCSLVATAGTSSIKSFTHGTDHMPSSRTQSFLQSCECSM